MNLIVGVLVGFATGLYFEHRSSAQIRGHNVELKKDLEALRHAVFSMGGQSESPVSVPPEDLTQRVLRRALHTQDSQGQVSVASLTAHFAGEGTRRQDVSTALAELCHEGKVRINGRWLEVI